MLLAIDIGNSSISIGIFVAADLLRKLKMPTHPKKTADVYKNKIKDFLSKNSIEIPLRGVIISSVVPELTEVFHTAVKGLSTKKPMTLTISLNTGLNFGVERPEDIGSDRIANVVAAREIFGSPVLVVDFGTATTISACKNGTFLGGAILPGLKLMSGALHRGTSKLPLVDVVSETGEFHIPAVGKNTTMNIISGIIYGTVGAVERLIYEMEGEEDCRFKIVITGGYSDRVARFLRREFTMAPELTLQGLRLIYKRNI